MLPCGHCPIQWKCLFPERSQWSVIGGYCVQGGGNSGFGFFLLQYSLFLFLFPFVVQDPSHVSFAKHSSKKGYSPICNKAENVSNTFPKVILCEGKNKLLTYTFGEDGFLTLYKNSSSESVILQDLKSPHCMALQSIGNLEYADSVLPWVSLGNRWFMPYCIS